MTYIQAAILGLVQGLTEFLPISSSAHLVLVPAYLGWDIHESQAFIFDVLVQWGTLLAVLIYFRKDILLISRATLRSLKNRSLNDTNAKIGWMIIIATLPAAVIGLLVFDRIEVIFVLPQLAGWLLLVTAVFLVAAEMIGGRTRDLESINSFDALLVGATQALALLPGISRSGATIAGAMSRNLKREVAARFSFLMSIPVMIGAGILALIRLSEIPNMASFSNALLIGFIISAIVGYLSIRWLLNFLASRSLYSFSIYCAAFGIISIWFFR